MARPGRPRIHPFADDGAEPESENFAPPNRDDPDGSDELAAMVRMAAAEIDTGCKYLVFKKFDTGRHGPRFEHRFTADGKLDLSELLDEIHERSGSGHYRLRLIRKNGTYAKTTDIAVGADDPASTTNRPLLTAPAALQSPAPAAVSLSSLEIALENFVTVSAKNQEMILAAITNAAKPAPVSDPVSLFKDFAAILASTRQSVPESAGKAVIETVREAVSLAREFAPGDGAGGADKTTGVWDVVRAVVENPGIIDTLKILAENLRPNVQQQGPPQQQQHALPAPAVAPGAPPIPAPAPNADGNPQGLFDSIMANTIPGLAAKAAANASPSLYAEVVLDSLPPDLSRTLANQPDILERLIERFPIVAEHRAWWERLLTELRSQLAEDDVPADDVQPSDSPARLHS